MDMPPSTLETPITHSESDIDLTNLYKTVPVNPASNQTRLIEIIGGPDTALQCRFHCVSLSDDPQYIALSYAWGPPPATRSIWIDGHQVPIRENLWLFLCQVRKRSQQWSWENLGNWMYGPGAWKYLWVDALCIDQGSIVEKNHQVQKMSEIYSKVCYHPIALVNLFWGVANGLVCRQCL
jgi:hypothetical protein